jgi:hypothetical protein
LVSESLISVGLSLKYGYNFFTALLEKPSCCIM